MRSHSHIMFIFWRSSTTKSLFISPHLHHLCVLKHSCLDACWFGSISCAWVCSYVLALTLFLCVIPFWKKLIHLRFLSLMLFSTLLTLNKTGSSSYQNRLGYVLTIPEHNITIYFFQCQFLSFSITWNYSKLAW